MEYLTPPEAIYADDVVAEHRAFLARRRALRPAPEYRTVTPEEWEQFVAHFELRKVALGVCTRDYGTPCTHENACVRCPALRPDPAQRPRLVEILSNLRARLTESEQHGWRGEVAGLEVSIDGAQRTLAAMDAIARRRAERQPVDLGLPLRRPAAERLSR